MTKLTYRERRRIVRDYYRKCRKGWLDRLHRWVRMRLDSERSRLPGQRPSLWFVRPLLDAPVHLVS